MMLVLQLEKKRQQINYESMVLSEINICAILSQLNKHEDAINHAIMAIKILESAESNNAIMEEGESIPEGHLGYSRWCELKGIAY